MSKAQAFMDVLGSMLRRVKPSNEEDIVRSILAQRPAIEKSVYGFTMDPRTGRMLKTKSDFGYSMATIPEDPALNRMAGAIQVDDAGNARVPISAADLEALVRTPYFMDELRRGANFGGWFDESTNEFVLDPSRRFVNRDRSILRGAKARQKAGFDLLGDQQYDLTPELVAEAAQREALRRALLGGAAGAAGTAGLLGLPDRD